MSEGNVKATAGAPKGNTNSLRHGFFAYRILNDEEKVVFDAIIAQLHHDFVFNQSSDLIQVELLAIYMLRSGQAQQKEDSDAVERLDRMIRAHLKDLKATRIAREGEGLAPVNRGTPADLVDSLLAKTETPEKKPRRRSSTKKKTQK